MSTGSGCFPTVSRGACFAYFPLITLKYEIIGGQAANEQPLILILLFSGELVAGVFCLIMLFISIVTIGFTKTQRGKEESDNLGGSGCL